MAHRPGRRHQPQFHELFEGQSNPHASFFQGVRHPRASPSLAPSIHLFPEGGRIRKGGAAFVVTGSTTIVCDVKNAGEWLIGARESHRGEQGEPHFDSVSLVMWPPRRTGGPLLKYSEQRRRERPHNLASSCLARSGLPAACNVRTLQERLGHKHVRTTTICSHVFNRGGRGTRRSADSLAGCLGER